MRANDLCRYYPFVLINRVQVGGLSENSKSHKKTKEKIKMIKSDSLMKQRLHCMTR